MAWWGAVASFDSIIKRNPESLSLKQRLDLGCPPEVLSTRTIAELWALEDSKSLTDKRHYSRLTREIKARLKDAIEDGSLKATKKRNQIRRLTTIRSPDVQAVSRHPKPLHEYSTSTREWWEVQRDHFRMWLISEGLWPLPRRSWLMKWWPDTQAAPSQTNEDQIPAEKRTRKDRLSIAINVAIDKLRTSDPLHQFPSTREIFYQLAEHDETKTIIDWTDEKLVWETDAGESRDTSIKALADRLTRLRKALK
ncbi:MAG TPA: hypothetical protein VKB53_08485 [Gammaproteobacteria bacterium]|nr:hypothetical protein [Gammaproteobacteria bacterium]